MAPRSGPGYLFSQRSRPGRRSGPEGPGPEGQGQGAWPYPLSKPPGEWWPRDGRPAGAVSLQARAATFSRESCPRDGYQGRGFWTFRSALVATSSLRPAVATVAAAQQSRMFVRSTSWSGRAGDLTGSGGGARPAEAPGPQATPGLSTAVERSNEAG